MVELEVVKFTSSCQIAKHNANEIPEFFKKIQLFFDSQVKKI